MLVYSIVVFAVFGLLVPAFAQDSRIDETDRQMMEEIRKCKADIDEKDEMTYAEKTVAKRNCEREVTIRYENSEIDESNPRELRAKLQNIQRCEDWHPQYNFLTDEQFKLQKNEEIVRDCILLYSDPIWDYTETDRPHKLMARLDEIKSDLSKSTQEKTSADIELPKTQPTLVETPQKQDRISELEEKVRLLEGEVAKKDAVIKEQLKTIMDLFNRIRNVIFEPLHFSWIGF